MNLTWGLKYQSLLFEKKPEAFKSEFFPKTSPPGVNPP
jgi:hypothetical protein